MHAELSNLYLFAELLAKVALMTGAAFGIAVAIFLVRFRIVAVGFETADFPTSFRGEQLAALRERLTRPNPSGQSWATSSPRKKARCA